MEECITVDYIENHRALLLADHNRRLAVVRDYVRGVAGQYDTGFYLFGQPGTAKTHTVRAMLDQIGQPYHYQRGHLTAMGLFELLDDHPDKVTVLDDLSSIFKNEVALQLLLAALEHPKSPDRVRVVQYRRQGKNQRVQFHGGIICISNRELHDDELLAAFRSRVHTLNYNPSDAQLGALMLEIAEHGAAPARRGITSAEAVAIAHYLIGELLRLCCRFDLRLFVDKALPDYQQWKDGEAESDWRDLVTASIQEHLVAVRQPKERLSRAERKEDEWAIAREIMAQHSNREARCRVWTERTGKSARAFYRRLEELQ